jgi:hypothetical protein
MTLIRYLMEGAVDGTDATTTNSQAASIIPGNGDIIFDSSRGRNGLGLAFISQPGQQTEGRWNASAPNATMSFRGWFWGPGSTPTETVALLNLRTSTGVAARFQWTTANVFIVLPATGGTLTLATGLSPTTQYDLSVQIVVGSPGSIKVTLRNTAGTTLGTINTSNFDSGTNAIAAAGVGIVGIYSQSYNSGWDEISFDDGSTSEIALYSPPSGGTGVGNYDLVWTGNTWR